jgi:hypothetical protein
MDQWNIEKGTSWGRMTSTKTFSGVIRDIEKVIGERKKFFFGVKSRPKKS